MRSPLLLAAALFAVSAAAQAAGDHIGRTALVVDTGTEVQEVVAPDTPKIVLHIELKGAEAGAKVTGTWIAVKTDVAPPNYKIDEAVLTLDSTLDEAEVALSKPDAGWPVGTYKVEVSYNGTVEKTVPFSVK